MKRQRVFALLSILAGCLASLAAVVLFISLSYDNPTAWRLARTYRLDPDLGFLHEPGSRSTWTDAHGNTEQFTINDLGLRGPPIPAKKSKPRVLLLGDSMVFGYGVSDSQTIAYQLEELTRASRRPIEAINAGVKGYGIDQEHELLIRLLHLRPDSVVWFIYENDFSRFNNVELTLYDYDPKTDELTERDLKSSIFYRSTSLYLKLRELLPTPVAESLLSPLWQLTNNLSAEYEARTSRGHLREKFRKLTQSVSDLSRTHGFKILVAIMPDRHHLEDLSDLKAHSALPLLDLNSDESFKNDWENLFLRSDPHLSPHGNKRIAQKIASWLTPK